MSKPLQYQTTMADRKRQRLLTSFMTGASQASAQRESDSATSKTLLHKSPETVNKPEAVDQTAAKPSESKACREFRDDWLKNYPWLEYDGHKMTCKTCVAEGKDNPFTSGCTNFRHSTLVRHMQTNWILNPLSTVAVCSGASKVSARNRLSAPRLNTLKQIAHGPEIEAFDFDSALKKWKESKRRKLFSAPNWIHLLLGSVCSGQLEVLTLNKQ